MSVWFLVVIGCTTIITQSKLFRPLREWLKKMTKSTFLECPMCVGFWVGFVLSILHFGVAPLLPVLPHPAPAVFRWWMDGCASSAVCWLFYVVTHHLGASSL